MTSINDTPINEPSLCIPFVFANITEERIREVFSHLELGEIERIDMVWRDSHSGGEHQRVFIHFKKWNSDENTTRTRQALHALPHVLATVVLLAATCVSNGQ